MSVIDRLTAYRRGIRPVSPDSFPRFVEQELEKVSTTSSELLAAVKALDARLKALEP